MTVIRFSRNNRILKYCTDCECNTHHITAHDTARPCAQEAATLLRGLGAGEQPRALRDAASEDLAATAHGVRACHLVLGAACPSLLD